LRCCLFKFLNDRKVVDLPEKTITVFILKNAIVGKKFNRTSKELTL